MRMFLVGMCDIFLLLYLTALAQMQERPASRLTVTDYRTLERNRDDLDKQRRDQDQRLADREAALRAAEEKLREAERRMRELEAAAAASRELSAAEQGELERLRTELHERDRTEQEQRQQVEQQLARLKLSAEEHQRTANDTQRLLEESRQHAARTAEQAAKEREQALSTAAEHEQRLREALQTAEQQQRLAAEAAERARQAEADALQARQAAEQAAKSEAQTRLNAQLAVTRAEVRAAEASKQRQEAEQAAVQAHESAVEASRERTAAQQKVQAVMQSAKRAYDQNVRTKAVPLTIAVKERGLLGAATDKLEFSLIAVRFGRELVVFLPLAQAKLDAPQDIEELDISVGPRPSTKFYVSRSTPRILAVVVPGGEPAAQPVPAPKSADDYMPTLIAARNRAPLSFGDRIRDLSGDYFFFQRDRLSAASSGTFAYRSSGFRGTGDYGERLVVGDQIVDLDGRYIGVVVDENVIMPVSSVQGWKAIALAADSAPALNELAAELSRK